MKLLINPNSYDKIKNFQRFISSRGIENTIDFEKPNLVMDIDDDDYEMVINLAQENDIFLERLL